MAVSMARAPFSPFLGTTRPTAVELSLVVLTALLSVLSEEMVFRGVVQSVLRPFGVRAACVVSSLLFAAQHLLAEPFGAYRLILLFCLGLVLAGSLESTGSLWYPVAVHAGWNLGAEGLAMLWGRGVDAVAAFYASPGFVAAEAAALVVLWLVVLRLTEAREASWRPTRPGEPD
jgi:membrane protease YdiL (CAAX protease family)